jgi:hypothetical protein
MDEQVWYYMTHDRSKYGPYTDGELASLIRQKIISPNDYIWMPALKGWLKVKESIYSFYLPSEESRQDA